MNIQMEEWRTGNISLNQLDHNTEYFGKDFTNKLQIKLLETNKMVLAQLVETLSIGCLSNSSPW